MLPEKYWESEEADQGPSCLCFLVSLLLFLYMCVCFKYKNIFLNSILCGPIIRNTDESRDARVATGDSPSHTPGKGVLLNISFEIPASKTCSLKISGLMTSKSPSPSNGCSGPLRGVLSAKQVRDQAGESGKEIQRSEDTASRRGSCTHLLIIIKCSCCWPIF